MNLQRTLKALGGMGGVGKITWVWKNSMQNPYQSLHGSYQWLIQLMKWMSHIFDGLW